MTFFKAAFAPAFLMLAGCVTYPYQTAFDACDAEAGACYRYCEEVAGDERDYSACHAECEVGANQCFASAYDRYSYNSSAYGGSYYAPSWPWYGRYGAWGPTNGYYFDFSYRSGGGYYPPHRRERYDRHRGDRHRGDNHRDGHRDRGDHGGRDHGDGDRKRRDRGDYNRDGRGKGDRRGEGGDAAPVYRGGGRNRPADASPPVQPPARSTRPPAARDYRRNPPPKQQPAPPPAQSSPPPSAQPAPPAAKPAAPRPTPRSRPQNRRPNDEYKPRNNQNDRK